MQLTTDTLADLRQLNINWKSYLTMLPALSRYYEVDKENRIKDTWERRMNPNLSGIEIFEMRLKNLNSHVNKAYSRRDEVFQEIPSQLWKNRFRQCVTEMKEQRDERDTLLKDACMIELLFNAERID